MPDMVTQLPILWPEVHAWLDAQGVAPAGPPFIRYHLVDMPARLDIEVGIPTGSIPPGNDRISSGAFPAGDYAVLTHTGPFDGLIDASARLQQWAVDNGVSLQRAETADGIAWAVQAEFYLTDPGTEPDPNQWQTQIVYLVG